MNLNEIQAIVAQPTIPEKVRKEVVDTSREYIIDEKDVEVIVDVRMIFIDVYNSHGRRIDRIGIKLNRKW